MLWSFDWTKSGRNKNREKKCNLGDFLINPKKNVERYNILKSKKTITIMNEYKYGSFLRYLED